VSNNKSRSGGGARKIGRNKVFCVRYANEGRRVRNKARRAARHARREVNRRFKIMRRLERLRAADLVVVDESVAA